MSKGDWRRPRSPNVSQDEYDSNYEAVFGKKKLNVWNKEEDDEQEECVQGTTESEGGPGGPASSEDARAPDPDPEGS